MKSEDDETRGLQPVAPEPLLALWSLHGGILVKSYVAQNSFGGFSSYINFNISGLDAVFLVWFGLTLAKNL